MDDLGLTGIGLDRAGDPVVETHSHCDQHITLIGLDVRGNVAVHSDHTLEMRVVRRQGAQTEKCGTCRDTSLVEEVREFLFRIAEDDSLAEDNERLFGRVDESDRRIDLGIRE